MHFSIIIPVLNEEKYLGILLDALVSQTYKMFEVIVVDGGSTDRTAKVVEKYNRVLKMRFLMSPQRGVIHQRNLGAAAALTDNLIFFDADAFVQPDFIARIKRIQERFNFDFFTSWNRPLSRNLFANLVVLGVNIYMSALQKSKPTANGPFMFVKKSAFDSVGGFSLKCFPCEDRYLFEHLFKAGYKFGIVKNPPVYVSTRRADKEGYVRYFLKILYMAYLYHKHGYIDPSWVEYRMG